MTSTTAAATVEIPKNAWPALWALVFGFFMILIDSTIVSVAIPSLITAFKVDINAVLWVTSAYLLAYAVPLLITGRLGDRFGPKRLYLTGLAVFTLASLWCGFTYSINALIVARVVQGLGASLMTPQTMAIITRIFPAQRRGEAMALWGATAGVATLFGPLMGGILIDAFSWEWIFFINVPIGILAWVLAWKWVPRLETHAHSFDIVGVLLSAVGLFCLVFGIQEGHAYNWGTISGPISVPLLIGGGGVLLVLFVVWQGRVKPEPLVPLSLFRDRNFSVANLAVTAVGFGITAMVFPFMLFAQVVLGLSPTHAALLTAPQAVLNIILARPAGKLVDRVHPRILSGIGLAGMAVGIYLMSTVIKVDTPIWQILAVSSFQGVFASLVWGPLSTSANRNLPMALAGAGSGVYNMTRQIGSVMGSAAIAVLMEARIAAHLPGVSQTPGAGSGKLPAAVAGPFAQALSESMLLPVAVVALGWIAALFFEKPRHMMG